MSSWEHLRLADCCSEIDLRSGRNDSLPIFSITKNSGIVFQADRFKKRIASKDISRYKVVEPGDFAFDPMLLWTGSISRNLTGQTGVVSPAYTVFRVEKHLNAEFLLLFLAQPERIGYYNSISFGTNERRRKAHFSDIGMLNVPAPPRPEQDRLVRLVSESAELLRLRSLADFKAVDLIPAIFHEMFGDLSLFPQHRADDICETIASGTTPKSSEILQESRGHDVPFLRVNHINDDGGLDFASKPSYISRDLHLTKMKRSAVKPGDVLMNIVGPPLGRIGIADASHQDWNINPAIVAFRPSSRILTNVLFYTLKSSKILDGILALGHGVRQLNINVSQCRELLLPLPPQPLQVAFSERVDEVRSLRSAQFVTAGRLNTLYQALLSRAFRGEL